MFEVIFSFIFEVMSRAVGTTFVALVLMLKNGFNESYPSIWRRVFSKELGDLRWVDFFGFILIIISIVGVSLALAR